jgi:serine acetyltransferase
MKERKVTVQQLIDHIKTAVDVDPWAQKMVEELLTDPQRRHVVYCNQCVHWDKGSGLSARMCRRWSRYTIQNDFCSYGHG